MRHVKTNLIVALLMSAMGIAVSAQTISTDYSHGWKPYEKGFAVSSTKGPTGASAIVCENSSADEARGAQYTLSLNQTVAKAFVVSAWSKCEAVGGSADEGYSLYLDLTYMDGAHLWGQISPFTGGTHDWQLRQVRIMPVKPVKEALVYLLFRRHIGKAWFSNVTASELGGKSSFDFQQALAPKVVSEGWFIRDLVTKQTPVPASDAASLGINAVVTKSGGVGKIRITSLHGPNRAITLYYCIPLKSKGLTWWNTIRSSKAVGDDECGTLTNSASGANGLSSHYPFAAVTSASSGRMIAVPPSIGPRVFRLFYNPSLRLLCAAFDIALTPKCLKHRNEGDAEVMTGIVDPYWGLRDAARQYYAAYPEAFKNRIARQGIWIPFTDPSKVDHPEDFGISVHEGDNSVESDARLGILSFRYTEPMTWWMNMKPEIPRTYENAMTVLHQYVDGTNATDAKQAQAVLTSASQGEDGRYNVSFENQPWANGAVWVINPNPNLPRSKGRAIQGDIVFAWPESRARYEKTKLSGEYLDSLEAHADVLDYRPESLAASTLCPSFDSSMRPVIPQAYSTYEVARFMSEKLHAIGKLLFANTTPVSFFGYQPLLDCSGIEVNWMDGKNWSPDDDDVFCYRRTLAYHKPYMLLQNTNFANFGPNEVAKYFKKCLFYGVFPSFFSADAATHAYWEDPKLYNRDRLLFKSTIPLLKTLAAAGWEPVTKARTNDPAILIERYGDHMWTLFNQGKIAKQFTVTFDNLPGNSTAIDVASGEPLKIARIQSKEKLTTTLDPGDCRVIRCNM